MATQEQSETVGRIISRCKYVEGHDDPSIADVREDLLTISAAGVAELTAALRDGDYRVRRSACIALGLLGPRAKSAVPELISMLHDDQFQTFVDYEDSVFACHWRDARNITARTLGMIGPMAKDAVPSLITLLRVRDFRESGWMRSDVVFALVQIGPGAIPELVEAARDQEESVRSCAISALGQIKPAALDTIRFLIDMLREEHYSHRETVATALAAIGSSAVPALVDAVRDHDEGESFRTWALRSLRQMGPAAKDAVPALIAALRDKGCDLQLMSSVKDARDIPRGGKDLIIVADVDQVLHFRIFDGDGQMVVDTDEKRLTDQAGPIEDLRKQLASLWPPHGLTGNEKNRVIDAVTSIVDHTRDEKVVVAAEAAYALGSIGPEASDAVPALLEALSNRYIEVMTGATWGLCGIGPAASHSVSIILDRMEAVISSQVDSCFDRYLKSCAAALGHMGAAAVWPLTVSYDTRCTSDQLRGLILDALVSMESVAVAELVAILRDRKSTFVIAALKVLVELGPPARAAIPAIVALLGHPDDDVRSGAANALKGIGREAIPGVIEALGNEAATVRVAAAHALELMGSIASDANPHLAKMLHDGDEHVRSAAARALSETGDYYLHELTKSLHDERPAERKAAAFALGFFGGKAHKAIPRLLEMVRDRDEQVRFTALESLRAIDATVAETVLKMLQQEANEAAEAAFQEWVKRGAPELEGIEVIEDKALRIKEALETFGRIGEICQERKHDRFSFKEMERLLGLEDSTIQDHIRYVSELFREYFKKYEGANLADDFDKTADVSRKVIHRPGSGAKPSICRPWGWRAWELACCFLKRREQVEAAKRRAGRPKA